MPIIQRQRTAYMEHQAKLESIKRVTEGAAWLDQVKPGWELLIDVSTLDISQPDKCVCGQLFEIEGNKLRVLQGLPALPTEFGPGYSFITDLAYRADTQHDWVFDHGFVHNADTETWVELIKERLNQGVTID